MDLGSSALACMGVQLPPLASIKKDVCDISYSVIRDNNSVYLINSEKEGI